MKPMQKTRNELCLKMIEIIDKEGENLTKWEINFVADIIDRKQKWFSEKQYDLIERIYEEKVGE